MNSGMRCDDDFDVGISADSIPVLDESAFAWLSLRDGTGDLADVEIEIDGIVFVRQGLLDCRRCRPNALPLSLAFDFDLGAAGCEQRSRFREGV